MVNRLFTWSEGLFHFDNELLPPNDKITVRINLENLIIDGTRKMREWEQLQGEIPSLEMALKFSDRPGSKFTESKPECRRMESHFIYKSQEYDPSDCKGNQ